MPSDPFPGSGGAAAKLALRDQLLTRRNRRSLAEVGACARALAAHLLAAPEVRRAATVAAYVSIGNEPGTGHLLDHECGRFSLLRVPGLGEIMVQRILNHRNAGNRIRSLDEIGRLNKRLLKAKEYLRFD